MSKLVYIKDMTKVSYVTIKKKYLTLRVGVKLTIRWINVWF